MNDLPKRRAGAALIRYLRPLGVVFAALMLDCATLTPIAAGTCGNGVVDADEDCDSFPEACGRPGGGATACRLTCDRATAGSCPSGWGCGLEGVCRQATGSFESAGAPTSAGVEVLIAGDFDGDGRADLFGGGPRNGTSKPRVHFFDGEGALAASVTLSVPMSLPSVRDFDGDGRDDLAYAFNADRFGAVGVLTGTVDRAFSPVLVPSSVRPETELVFASIPFDVERGYVTPSGQGAVVTLEHTASGNAFRTISGYNVTNVVELEEPSSFGPEQVVGAPVSAVLFAPSPSSTCGQVLFAYNAGDAGHLAILSPCSLGGGASVPRWQSGQPVDIVLPAKVTGKVVVDATAALPSVLVTLGDGSYRAISDGEALGAFTKVDGAGGENAATPLAVGDLDGDGRADRVLPTAFVVTGTPGRSPVGDGGAGGGERADTLVARPTSGRWQDARIGSFNADARPDVVAFSEDALELELFVNAGESLFTRFSVPSSKPVRAITTGDFDGDRIEDVAFLSAGSALGGEPTEAQLSIAYGRASGGPEAPRVVGAFHHASGLTAVRQSNRTIDELVVVERTPRAGLLPSTSMTVIYGSGDRQAIAPLVFSDKAATSPVAAPSVRRWQAAALLAAPFVDATHVDVLTLAYGITWKRRNSAVEYVLPFPTGSWFARAEASGGLGALAETYRFDPAVLQAVNDVDYDARGVVQTWLLAAAADLDSPPDGISEIVTVNRGEDPNKTLLVVANSGDLQGKVPVPVPLGDFGISGADDELSLVDVDSDGLRDLLLLTRPGRDAEGGAARARIRVYLNDGKRGFVMSPIVIELPNATGAAPEGPLGVARVVTGAAASGKAQAELAIVSSRRLFLAKLDATRTRFELRDATDLMGAPLSGKLTAIASGDYDGDGVQDLAIADSGSIRLLRQRPRLR